MIKSWIAFWTTALALLLGLLFWKNTKSYAQRSRLWRLGKSLVDFALILMAAIRLPALLIGWCVLWATRPIKHPALKATVAVIAGLLFGLAGHAAMEILVLCSVFAVDLVTGRAGFLRRWEESKPGPRAVAA
jgi:hypothetical protein